MSMERARVSQIHWKIKKKTVQQNMVILYMNAIGVYYKEDFMYYYSKIKKKTNFM